MKKRLLSTVVCIISVLAIILATNPINSYASLNKVNDSQSMPVGNSTFTATTNGVYCFDIAGAGGGGGSTNGWWNGTGGSGGRAIVYIKLNKGDSVSIHVGAGGENGGGYHYDNWEGTFIQGNNGGHSYASYKGSTIATAYGGTGGWHDHTSPSSSDGEHTSGGNGSNGSASASASYTGYSSATYYGGGGGGTCSMNGGNGWCKVTLVKLLLGIQEFDVSPNSWTNTDITVKAVGTDVVTQYKFEDGEWSESNIYTISDNGTYTFYVKDESDNIVSETLEINNIDKKQPLFSITTNKKPVKTTKVTINAVDE